MSYVYLFDLYEMIEQRFETIENSSSELPRNSGRINCLKGQRDVLVELKSYLEKQLNPKLPRAIQKKLREKS